MLEMVIAAGVDRFRHDGQILSASYLPTYLFLNHFVGPTAELQLTLSVEQRELLFGVLQG